MQRTRTTADRDRDRLATVTAVLLQASHGFPQPNTSSVLLIIRANVGGRVARIIENTDNPKFIFYTRTAPLARHRLRNFSSHTLPTPVVCSCAPVNELHRDIAAFMNQILCVVVL
jgi:hypothetical protein